ncbi:tyrosine-type recombinase/integrase [Endozoicomonas sp. 8E]|uniref:tyrosine-type recombinase/integrase n=1 Tax=Endozoicomonas sp. 8E TaxID=3035692 RepID=UPI0029392080|nr:tyrosine-type recombinase/integrase [Endozoicomonas sp. 8E]WOG25381.1 tyrosine-type recombinase/integrase [Endozoicomonas sp. 8E]
MSLPALSKLLLLPGGDHPHHQSDLSSLNTDMTGAVNDSEILTLFLNKSAARSGETLRRYEREILRFSAWLYQDMGATYKEVRLKHLQMYLHHLQNLPDRWLKKGILPGQPERILFKAPIKPGKSTDQIIDVLSSFFSFLEKNRYTPGNPAVSLVRSGEKLARGTSIVRFFHEEEWQHLLNCLELHRQSERISESESARTRYIIMLGYGLGLRESELTGHSCNDIHPDIEGGYFLSILGKGRKRRQLPLNNKLIEEIKAFRQRFHYEGLLGDDFPLAPRTRKIQGKIGGLSSRGLRFWWQSFMDFCASQSNGMAVSNSLRASRFKAMPFHALRHTALTHLARQMDIEDLAIFAGHDSINTTSQYYHTEARRLKQMTETHFL